MDTLHIFWIFSKVYMNEVSSSSDLGHWLILHMQERGEMVGSKPMVILLCLQLEMYLVQMKIIILKG